MNMDMVELNLLSRQVLHAQKGSFSLSVAGALANRAISFQPDRNIVLILTNCNAYTCMRPGTIYVVALLNP